MQIEAIFENEITGKSKRTFLPITQDYVKEIFDLIGVIYRGISWKKSLENINCNVTYSVSCDYIGSFNIKNLIDCEDFVIVNLIAKAFEELNDDDIEIVGAYLTATGDVESGEEFINILLQKEDVNLYSYEYDGDMYEAFGKTMASHSDSMPNDGLWDYVDWETYGRDVEDGYILTEYGYLDIYDPGDIDVNYFDFDDICNECGWDLSEADKELSLHIDLDTLFNF